MKTGQHALKTWLNRQEAVEAIRHLSEDDLLFLNAHIIERLKLIAQAQSTIEIARFSLGDRVKFTGHGGKTVAGIIIRLNKKTVGVQGEDGRQWKVSPSLLTHQ